MTVPLFDRRRQTHDVRELVFGEFDSDVELMSGDSAGYWLSLPGTYRHGHGMAILGQRSYGRPLKVQ